VSKVYDIAALRVIVDTMADCYRVLGIVNNLVAAAP
jgi:(p)ppGpp synthase/HD superfamily hydrolase